MENLIEEILENRIRLKKGTEIKPYFLVYATGFDSVLWNTPQRPRQEPEWTYSQEEVGGRCLLIPWHATTGSPSLFWWYGPQVPIGFANGPTCIETQGEWILSCLWYLRREGFTRIEVDSIAEKFSRWVPFVCSTRLIVATSVRTYLETR